MPHPHLDAQLRGIDGPDAVLIPLRSLRTGKQRLGATFTAEQRASMITFMADRVVRAAHELPVLIVHDDPAVANWAAERGAASLQPTTPGLNEAVTAGRDLLADRGVERVIVAHADLPEANDLRLMLSDDAVSIAPDRHRAGTNVLCVATALPFTFAYGPGSFERHCEVARSLGVDARIVEAPDLSRDINHPDDLDGLDALTRLLQQEQS